MSSITNLSSSLGDFPGDDKSSIPTPLPSFSSPTDPITTGNSYPEPERKRLDPRTGEILSKETIPHPSGRMIKIDFNPKTGGVFLDSGELKDLSEVKDIIPRLETILSRYQ